MIDELSIIETDKVIHTVETDMVKFVVEIECFGMSFDEFDKETGSSDGLQPKQADLSCVHALNEPYLHEIHVVPSKHEVDQFDTLFRVLTLGLLNEPTAKDMFQAAKQGYLDVVKSSPWITNQNLEPLFVILS
ncbi:hypothetical protein Tco_0540832 [Tanacetum coccineum]